MVAPHQSAHKTMEFGLEIEARPAIASKIGKMLAYRPLPMDFESAMLWSEPVTPLVDMS